MTVLQRKYLVRVHQYCSNCFLGTRLTCLDRGMAGMWRPASHDVSLCASTIAYPGRVIWVTGHNHTNVVIGFKRESHVPIFNNNNHRASNNNDGKGNQFNGGDTSRKSVQNSGGSKIFHSGNQGHIQRSNQETDSNIPYVVGFTRSVMSKAPKASATNSNCTERTLRSS